MAIGALNALSQLNKRVPEDLAVVGYDNIRMAEVFNPAITTIAQPLYRIGETAMEAVLARISDPNLAGETVRFKTTLIVRNSSSGVSAFSTGHRQP